MDNCTTCEMEIIAYWNYCPYCGTRLLKNQASKDFEDWVEKTYPEIHLTDWQQTIAGRIWSCGRGAGKSTIIRLLYEYDQKEKRRTYEHL